jgi:truncated hemoglobin YjbI
MPGSTTPTIYQWAGGTPAFERWLNVFYDVVERDELLTHLFAGGVGPEHREHVTAWWCEVMGGPPATRRGSSQPPVIGAGPATVETAWTEAGRQPRGS